MSNPRSALYRVKSCNFDVGGTKYDVSSVSLDLSLGAIPSCSVGIAPYGGGGNRVHKLSLGELKGVYSALCAKAVGLTVSNLELRVSVKNVGSLDATEESISLKGWLLRDVSLQNVTTTSRFSLVCTIVHPAYRMAVSFGPFFQGDAGIDPFKQDVEGVEDPISAGVVAYRIVERANKDAAVPRNGTVDGVNTVMRSLSDVSKDVGNHMAHAMESLGNLVRWDSSFSNAGLSVPYADVAGSLLEGVKYAMVVAWVSAGVSGDVWSDLAKVCGTFGAVVVPTYDQDKLVACPFNPWIRPKVHLPDYYVDNIGFPRMDERPLYGTAICVGSESKTTFDTVTFAVSASSGAAIEKANIAFVPDSVDKSTGMLELERDIPYWLSDVIYWSQSKEAYGGAGSASAANTWAPPTPDLSPTGRVDGIDKSENILATYLANKFMTMYRASSTAALSCAFIPIWGGLTVVPGMRVSFDSDGTLFTGLISQMRHYIDFASSTARTYMSLSHCLDGDYDANTGNPPCCPMYRAKA